MAEHIVQDRVNQSVFGQLGDIIVVEYATVADSGLVSFSLLALSNPTADINTYAEVVVGREVNIVQRSLFPSDEGLSATSCAWAVEDSFG